LGSGPVDNSSHSAGPAHEYVLGHSEREVERLIGQAHLIDPITTRFFLAAGIGPGMRVLDVGSGAGDVAFVVSDIVGPHGMVVGADRVPAAVQVARDRLAERPLQNVSFLDGDPAELAFDQPFDAVVGRYVLQFQREPEAMLRQLATKVRRGGVVVFHEIDWGGLSSFPPVPTYDQCAQWGAAAMRLHGTETRMGSRLHATFVAAGLPAPTLRLEALAVGGMDSIAWLRSFKDLIVTLLPESERLGVASACEVSVETRVERMNAERSASSSIFIGHHQIAAWARV
jgi:SAM-dependent methyltransferase